MKNGAARHAVRRRKILNACELKSYISLSAFSWLLTRWRLSSLTDSILARSYWIVMLSRKEVVAYRFLMSVHLSFPTLSVYESLWLECHKNHTDLNLTLNQLKINQFPPYVHIQICISKSPDFWVNAPKNTWWPWNAAPSTISNCAFCCKAALSEDTEDHDTIFHGIEQSYYYEGYEPN